MLLLSSSIPARGAPCYFSSLYLHVELHVTFILFYTCTWSLSAYTHTCTLARIRIYAYLHFTLTRMRRSLPQRRPRRARRSIGGRCAAATLILRTGSSSRCCGGRGAWRMAAFRENARLVVRRLAWVQDARAPALVVSLARDRDRMGRRYENAMEHHPRSGGAAGRPSRSGGGG